MVYVVLLVIGLEAICLIDCNLQLLMVLFRALQRLLQGSILGPLLFLLYVNDIANSVPDQNIKLFADDTNLFISTTNQSLLDSIANEAMSNLNSWFIVNRLSLNLDKTCYMVFSPRRLDSRIEFNLQLNGTAMQKVESCPGIDVMSGNGLNILNISIVLC